MSEQEDTDGLVEITDSEIERSKGNVPLEETQPPSFSRT